MLGLLALVLSTGQGLAGFTNFVNFETAPVHPIALGPDGRTLAVCNLPDNRVELFDVSSGVPVAAGSVPVGLDPVTVRFASSNELWVVNHISSSLSIIDLAARQVVMTLDTPAGPSDLVFAGSPRRAWISCSRTNAVYVVDPQTRLGVATLAIDGERPRAMAASPDGSKVYVAIFESGNGSTVLGTRLTPIAEPPEPGPVDDPSGPYGGVNPPPNKGTNFFPAMALTNAPPRVSLIVKKNSQSRWMDDNTGDWTEWVSGTNAAKSDRIAGWDLPDHDLAIIDTAALGITYAQRLMNICMAVGVNPVSGEVAVVGTDATNERRFEPVLNGVFLRVELAMVDPVTRTNRLRDLNPHLDYVARTIPPEERALSVGDPRGIEWSSDGMKAYITGMGSRNLVIVDADGQRTNPQVIELEEGPTGLALDETRGHIYVWNRFSSSISVVDSAGGSVLTNVPVYDPTPEIVRKGRRHLYDTRKTSGLGIVSCASCHVDGRGDRLAWDLGNPAGSLVTNGGFVFHPMKGPMVTQTLQDIITPTQFNGFPLVQQPLHWRGDRKGLEDFNGTFTNLQSADTVLTTNEMEEFKAMLASIYFPPNYLRTFSNSLPASLTLPGFYGQPTNSDGSGRLPLPPGNPQRGLSRFSGTDCRLCHDFNQGRNINITELLGLGRDGTQVAFKAAQLRSIAEKVGMDGWSTNSRAGFGFMHDGRVDSLTSFLTHGFPGRAPTDTNIADFVAFLLCFSGSDLSTNPSGPSQDVPAATGKQTTLLSSTPTTLLNSMYSLALRTNSRVELVLRGKKNGQLRSWLLQRSTQVFQPDVHYEGQVNLSELLSLAGASNPITALLVPQGSGRRTALDRDGDGYYDASELELGFNPADPTSRPGRIVSIAKVGNDMVISWQSAPGASYTVEWATNFPALPASPTWNVSLPFISNEPLSSYPDPGAAGLPARFYRVRLNP